MESLENLLKVGDLDKIEEYCESDAFMSLQYAEKNKHFITSSKIKDFKRCPFCYQQKYVNGLVDPTAEGKDYFLVGQALDDWVTHGIGGFLEKYEVVAKRSKDAEKTQLTRGMKKTIDQMSAEFVENKLFNQKPEKKVFVTKFGHYFFKAELDDYDGKTIRDIKTSANVKKFDPEMYLIQAAFYQWVVEERTGKTLPVMLEIVDKNSTFSRSRCIQYHNETLRPVRGEIMCLLEDIEECEESGIFPPAREQVDLWDCSFYGCEGHGRPTEIEIY